ncbi:hypothetical protein FACS1894202_14650 [Clostridia bacterium]|nr:hypothetical protein FACS1894202_14650 [Clostridia bacterium]
MTAVRIGKDFIKISGHSGYAASSSDIVCAAISSATELLSATLDELGERYEASTADAVAELRVDTSSPAVRAYRRHVANIAENYPKYVKLEEV